MATWRVMTSGLSGSVEVEADEVHTGSDEDLWLTDTDASAGTNPPGIVVKAIFSRNEWAYVRREGDSGVVPEAVQLVHLSGIGKPSYSVCGVTPGRETNRFSEATCLACLREIATRAEGATPEDIHRMEKQLQAVREALATKSFMSNMVGMIQTKAVAEALDSV